MISVMSSIIIWLDCNAYFCAQTLLNTPTPVESFHKRAPSCLLGVIPQGCLLLSLLFSPAGYSSRGDSSILGGYSVIYGVSFYYCFIYKIYFDRMDSRLCHIFCMFCS